MINTLSQRLREHLAAVYGDAFSEGALNGWVDRLLEAAQLSAAQVAATGTPQPVGRDRCGGDHLWRLTTQW